MLPSYIIIMHQFQYPYTQTIAMLQSNAENILALLLSEVDINSRRHVRIVFDAIHPAEVEYKDILHIWINLLSFNQGVTGR